MSQQVALYGFVRQKDGLKICPRGIGNEKCTLLYGDLGCAAVISLIKDNNFKASATDMIRHEETVTSIFNKQVMLPAKFPKVIGMTALERSMSEMKLDLQKVLNRIVYKSEYYVRIFMNDAVVEETPARYLNTFSKYIMRNSSQYKYKHYFPLLTREAREAEFVEYAEIVLKHISHELCAETTYWRGKNFQSEKILLESYFWVRKHKAELFESRLAKIKKHYPNLIFSVLGPSAPYNFVQLEFAERL